MQSLSPSWSLRSLESLCKRVSSGGTPSRKNPEFYVDGSNLWVKSQELIDSYIYDTDEKITDAAVTKSSAKPYPSDTVLIAMYGATVGKLAILKTEATVNQAICALVVNDEIADYRFVYHALKLYRPSLISKAHGAAQQNLNQGLIKEFEIAVPPLETQRQIAAILSAYDDLIENNARRIKVLEEMAGLIYREWFVNFRFPGHQGVRRVALELGEIPEGWEVGRLDDALILQRGFDLPKSSRQGGDIPIIAATGIVDYHNEVKAKAPGIVTGRSGSLGTVLYVDVDFWPLNTALWVKTFKKATPLYALYLLSGLGLEQFNSGAAVPTLNRNDVHGLPVVLPPQEFLKRFDDVVLPIFEQMRILKSKNQNLRRTRDLLLPKLISGELDVSQLGADPENVQDLADLRAAKAAEGESPALSLDELKLTLERG